MIFFIKNLHRIKKVITFAPVNANTITFDY